MADLFPDRHQLILERRRFAKQFSISEEIRVEWRESVLDEERYLLACELFSSGTREHGIDLPIFSVPADWWQAVKERWFPGWALRRWPVQRKTLGGGRAIVDVEALFPDLQPMRNSTRIEYWVPDPRFIGSAYK